MKVVVKEVSQCKNGDILASDVFNERGVIFAAKDTVINDFIKNHFIKQGIERVSLYKMSEESENNEIKYDKLKKNYKDSVLTTKGLLQELTAGKPLDYKKVSDITCQVYKNLNENDNIIKCLGEIRNSDEYTYSHCVNTALYSMLIAKWLGLDKIEIDKIIQAGLLHDIGKTRIPKDILNKNGRLTDEEYEIIKKHATIGFAMVKDINELDEEIKKAILLHHERLDGSGYPTKASFDDISLYSRIIAIADVFDAMTSDRIYKKRVTPFDAFEMFQTDGLSMYDTKIINVFLNGIAANLVGSRVQFHNGEIGEIVYIPLNNMVSPIVKVSSVLVDLAQESSLQIIRML